MDLTQPIDITSVNEAVRKNKDVLVSIQRLTADRILKYATPIPGVRDSITLGRKEGGQILKKYNGVFVGDGNLGRIVPRKLTVYPVVGEIQDEPERYRRSFITEVAGGLWDKKHPFEVFLIQDALNQASEDLLTALMVAKHSDEAADLEIKDSFDGWGQIVEAEKTAGNIAANNGNMYETGVITRANAGDKLLDMYRAMPQTFKDKASVNMIVSYDVADLYDDWYKDEHERKPEYDASGQAILEGTQGKCHICRIAGLPEGSQLIILTTKQNMVYGYDKESDMKGLKAFFKDPYLFTAALKFVFGCQFVSIHKSEFCVNDQPLTPLNPVVTATPSTLAITGTTEAAGTCTVTIVGSDLSSAVTAAISGDDAALFTKSGTLTAEGGTLTITYTPTVAGSHEATLTLSATGATDVVIEMTGTSAS